jgi:hypothetical protein
MTRRRVDIATSLAESEKLKDAGDEMYVSLACVREMLGNLQIQKALPLIVPRLIETAERGLMAWRNATDEPDEQ